MFGQPNQDLSLSHARRRVKPCHAFSWFPPRLQSVVTAMADSPYGTVLQCPSQVQAHTSLQGALRASAPLQPLLSSGPGKSTGKVLTCTQMWGDNPVRPTTQNTALDPERTRV